MLLNLLLFPVDPFFAQPHGSAAQQLSHDHKRTRRNRRTGIRHTGGVGIIKKDFVYRKIQFTGNDFGESRANPLTDLPVGCQNLYGPIFILVKFCHRLDEIPFSRTRESCAVEHQ